jgi:prepilin-type N-terminal cleavage/methylation domain-containing protein
MNYRTTSRGFTLVEMLVVIAIISFLTSILYANFAVARSKSADNRKKVDLALMQNAVAAYNLDHQGPPNMYDCSGATCVVNNNRATAEVEDSANPDNPQTESGKAYRATMQELVAGRYMPSIPSSPGGAGYFYYAYGSGSAAGAVVGTTMSNDPPSTSGQPGTCRPFASGGTSGGDIDPGFSPSWYSPITCTTVDGFTSCVSNQDLPVDTSTTACSQSSNSDYCLCTLY